MLSLKYNLIPTRYFDDLPDQYLEQLSALFVNPFIKAYQGARSDKPLFLTVIVKPLHLDWGTQRDEILSWCTGFQEIDGIYLLFENNFYTKQIKNPEYLAGQLRFIRALRNNGIQVHIGYSGLESILLSIADPTSVSIASYDNLRSFGVLRLETRERTNRRGPNPRIYSGQLLQSMENTYLPAMKELVPDWQDYFDDSPYKSFLLEKRRSLSFQRPELYKHYFFVLSRQLRDLPNIGKRAKYISEKVRDALAMFERIRSKGVYLDSDSDGSHLPAWLNAIAMYESRPE